MKLQLILKLLPGIGKTTDKKYQEKIGIGLSRFANNLSGIEILKTEKEFVHIY